MTVSSTATFTFNIGQIVTMAYREAGVVSIYLSPTAQQTSAALDELERIVHSTQAKGLFARTVDFFTLTPLVLTQYIYTLPLNALDVIGAGMYIDPTQADITRADAETQVLPMSREQWQELTGKSAQGRPTMYYPHRVGDQVQLYIWPIPGASEAGGSVRFQIHRYRADVRDVTATTDFERYWVDWITSALAAQLAKLSGMSIQRVMMCRGDAASKLTECRKMANQRVSQMFVARHRTGMYR